jgi:hypothetical protein
MKTKSSRASMATITVKIPDPTEERLRVQARAAGKPVEQYVREVLEAQTAPTTTLREISGSVYPRFVATGMSEEELAETLEREDHAARGVPYDE